MVAQANVDVRFCDYDECDTFVKIRRRHERPMPTRKSTSAKRAALRTPGSRRAARRVSRISSGAHRRRIKHIR